MIIINHNVGQKCGAMTCDYKDHIMNNKMQGKYQIYTHDVSPKFESGEYWGYLATYRGDP